MDVKTLFISFCCFPRWLGRRRFFFTVAESWQCLRKSERVSWASGRAWESEINPGLSKSLRVAGFCYTLWWHIMASGWPSHWPAWCLQPWPTHTGPGSLSTANLELHMLIIFMMPIFFISLAYSSFQVGTVMTQTWLWDTYLFILAFYYYHLIIHLTVNLIYPCIWLIFNLFSSYYRFLIWCITWIHLFYTTSSHFTIVFCFFFSCSFAYITCNKRYLVCLYHNVYFVYLFWLNFCLIFAYHHLLGIYVFILYL